MAKTVRNAAFILIVALFELSRGTGLDEEAGRVSWDRLLACADADEERFSGSSEGMNPLYLSSSFFATVSYFSTRYVSTFHSIGDAVLHTDISLPGPASIYHAL